MSFIGVAIGGSVLNAGLGYLGATKAADTQAQSAQNALAFQQQVYNQNQPRYTDATNSLNSASASYQPWVTSGQNANYTLSNLMGGSNGGSGNTQPDYSSFFNSPDYNFAQSQGQKGVINGANAQGVGLSGGTLKDLATFNSGLATQQYGNYFNRLMQMSQAGQSAAGGQANVASSKANLAVGAASNNNSAATSIGNTTQAVGQAQASGIVGGTNAITGSVNSGISNSLLANYLGKSPSAYGGSAANAGTSNAVSNGGFNYLDAQA